jgi:hypothetical protein
MKTKSETSEALKAAACDWKYERDETKRCEHAATTINPPTGLKFCARHTRRFHGMEDLVPLDAAKGERE